MIIMSDEEFEEAMGNIIEKAAEVLMKEGADNKIHPLAHARPFCKYCIFNVGEDVCSSNVKVGMVTICPHLHESILMNLNAKSSYSHVKCGDSQHILNARNIGDYLKCNPLDDRVAILTQGLDGSASAPSKRHDSLRVSFGWSGNLFRKGTNALSSFMHSPAFAVVVLKREDVSDDILKMLEEKK